MNNQIKLAVAAALLAAASSANAGISIPAGDWTLDIGGVVNAFYTNHKATGSASAANIGTGLLPNVLAVSGSTRQNDLDVTFVIAIDPGGYTKNSLSAGGTQENRQAFFTFGDKSWGTIKLGKDLGVFASDAILNDMTLLGVGFGSQGAGTAGGATTLGGIGAGYLYADWKEQIAYTTPNMNGFSATVAVTQPYNQQANSLGVLPTAVVGGISHAGGGSQPAYEAKASYDFAADAVKGKVWVSGYSQKVDGVKAYSSSASLVGAAAGSFTANAGDIGVNLNAAGFGLTGYVYTGSGVGSLGMLDGGIAANGAARDSSGGYVQATYVLPTATKIGAAYGQSKIDAGGNDVAFVYKSERYTVGAYHPLTKHVNLVAEYNNEKVTSSSKEVTTNTVSLGGILFF